MLGKFFAVLRTDLSAGHFGEEPNASLRLIFIEGKAQFAQVVSRSPIATRRRVSASVETRAAWCPPRPSSQRDRDSAARYECDRSPEAVADKYDAVEAEEIQ